jgi:hypothetical protein
LRTLLPAALAAALLACGTGTSDLEERIPVQPGGLLEVDLYMGEGLRPDKGSLEVTSHDANEVRIAADASGWGASGVNFRVEHDSSTVRLYGRVTGALSWLFGGPQLAVRIWVPREFSLDLRTSAGPVRIDDVSGRIRARAADAPIEVSAAAGSLRLRTNRGDVRVSEVEGDVDVRASAGHLELSWITGDVTARTGRGEISADHVSGLLTLASGRGGIEIRDVKGPATAKTESGGILASFSGAPAGELETSRGSVRVVVPADAGADLEAISRRGSVELAPELLLEGTRNEAHVVGRLGPGGAPLRLYTAHGSVYLSRR